MIVPWISTKEILEMLEVQGLCESINVFYFKNR